MPFDSTPGGPVATSYISVEDAKIYFKDRLHSELWETFADKKSALITSTRVLNRFCVWAGIKATLSQALDWPRVGAVDKDGYSVTEVDVPVGIKEACCEMAYALLEEDRTVENDMMGISSLKVGTLHIVADRFDRPEVIPNSVWAVLGPLALPPKRGMVPVVRW